MRITIVNGFFLPVPPVAGGAMEKGWWRLAREFAARGHDVTILSRSWKDWPDREKREGVSMIRLPGFNHRRSMWRNLFLDTLWGTRVFGRLPDADILVTNTVGLPVYVGAMRPRAGRLVVNLNRFPKGQLRWYRRVARIQAASPVIAEAAAAQAPGWRDVIRVVPNPVAVAEIAAAAPAARAPGPLRIGYVGRLNPEKGLDGLVDAATLLLGREGLPDWELVLRGPADIPRGGGGDAFLAELRKRGDALLKRARMRIEPPMFDDGALFRAYHELDIFCYPSVAEKGEAQPVAPVEAMAAGKPVVVSDLGCFSPLVRDRINGRIVPRANPAALADALADLLAGTDGRARLGAEAARSAAPYDTSAIATLHLDDYASLLGSREGYLERLRRNRSSE